jgi:hypothetical protein
MFLSPILSIFSSLFVPSLFGSFELSFIVIFSLISSSGSSFLEIDISFLTVSEAFYSILGSSLLPISSGDSFLISSFFTSLV